MRLRLRGALALSMCWLASCQCGSSTLRSSNGVLALNPRSLDFGHQPPGAKVLLTLTLSNEGSASMQIVGLSVRNDARHAFSVAPSTATLAAQDHLTVQVTYTAPATEGDDPATLSIETDSRVTSEVLVSLVARTVAACAPRTCVELGHPCGQWVDCAAVVDCGSCAAPDSGTRSDAGVLDAGAVDAGTGALDAGTGDAGSFDAGVPDAGKPDAGMADAGMADAGPKDAGASDAATPDAGGCVLNSTRGCYGGPAGTAGVGACRAGLEQCQLGDGGLAYGPCTGQVLPTAETANDIDDDCNTIIDDGYPCTPDASVSCYTGPGVTTGVGVCHGGTQTCLVVNQRPAWSGCLGEVTPKTEDVDASSDLDCDGFTRPAKAVALGVSDDGSHTVMVQMGTYGTAPQRFGVACFDAQGTLVGTQQYDYLEDLSFSPSVARAKGSGVSASLVIVRSSADVSDGGYRLRVVDANCAPLGSADLNGPVDYGDLAIDNAGNTYVAWPPSPPLRVELWSFSVTGALRWTQVVTTNTWYATGGKHVAFDSVTNRGVVTGQGLNTDPLIFRRFGVDGGWFDSVPQEVAGSDGGRSSLFDSHTVGMLDGGAFAIKWVDARDVPQVREWVNFYTATGGLLGTALLSSFTSSSSATDTFDRPLPALAGTYYPTSHDPAGNSWVARFSWAGADGGTTPWANQNSAPIQNLCVDSARHTYLLKPLGLPPHVLKDQLVLP